MNKKKKNNFYSFFRFFGVVYTLNIKKEKNAGFLFKPAAFFIPKFTTPYVIYALFPLQCVDLFKETPLQNLVKARAF